MRGLLGVSDPDVHWIDGRWTMFLGGFTTRFRNSLFTAVLLTAPRHLGFPRYARALLRQRRAA